MPSDMSHTKYHAYVTESGDPAATLPCPSCPKDMVMTDTTLLWLTHTGRVDPRVTRRAEASHTVPGADGGKLVALECAECNADRNRALWVTDRPTYKVYKRRTREVASARAHVRHLRSLGYP